MIPSFPLAFSAPPSSLFLRALVLSACSFSFHYREIQPTRAFPPHSVRKSFSLPPLFFFALLVGPCSRPCLHGFACQRSPGWCFEPAFLPQPMMDRFPRAFFCTTDAGYRKSLTCCLAPLAQVFFRSLLLLMDSAVCSKSLGSRTRLSIVQYNHSAIPLRKFGFCPPIIFFPWFFLPHNPHFRFFSA